MGRVVAVLLAALCFGTTGTAAALADVDASPLAVGAARIALGGGLLGLIALAGRRRRGARDRLPLGAVAAGALGVLAYQPAFFLGTRTNGVAVGTLIALGSAPVLTGALESVLRRARPTGRWLVATTVAVVGVALLAGVLDPARTDGVQPIGVVASLLAGAAYATYAVATKSLLDHGAASTDAVGAIFGVAAVCSVPVLLLAGPAPLATPSGAALVLWLGVVTTTVAYLLYGWGLRRLRAATASTLTLAEPLAATLLGIAVLHEQLPETALAGVAVVAAGLLLLTLPDRRRRPLPSTA